MLNLCTHQDIFVFRFYRPNPKDDGRLCFHFVHHFGGGVGGTPSQVWKGLGVPHPRSGRGGGRVSQPKVWMEGGYPIPGLDGGYPIPGLDRVGGAQGTPSSPGWGTSHQQDGVPPCPGQDGGGYLNWNSMACTCYAAGGMPLAFTQEEFLVCMCIQHLIAILDLLIQNILSLIAFLDLAVRQTGLHSTTTCLFELSTKSEIS